MKRRAFAVIIASAFTALAQGQANRASMNGVVTGPFGVVVDAPIQAKHKETGAVARTMSGPAGRYTLSGLAPGVYDISINMPCCAFNPFARNDVAVRAGESLQLDLRLEEGGSLNTLGDDPGTIAAMMRNRAAVPRGPAPRTRDGKPDLGGVWLTNTDLYPEPPDALPWAARIAKERIEDNFKDHPHTRCLPGNPHVDGQSAPFIAKLVQTPGLLVILMEGTPGYRQIFLDGRKHPADPDPSWLGHSIGRWEKDTLVVDTIGFNDRGWTGAHPRTEKLHMVERYRRTEFGRLEVRITIEDPGVFQKPWIMNEIWNLAPQEELIEFVCENNKAGNLPGK
jgi:hypothetical protein